MNLGQMPSVSKATVGLGFSNELGPQRIKLLSKLRQLRGSLRLRENVGAVAGRFEIVEWGHFADRQEGSWKSGFTKTHVRQHKRKIVVRILEPVLCRSLQMLRGMCGHSQPHDEFHESDEKLHELVTMTPLLLRPCSTNHNVCVKPCHQPQVKI